MVKFGSEYLMEENTIEIRDLKARASRYSEEGKTPIYVAVDGRVAGLAAVADTLKEDTIQALEKLKAEGIELIMLTGDNRRTAEANA